MNTIAYLLINLSRRNKLLILIFTDCLIAFSCWVVFGPPFSLLIATDFQKSLFELIAANYISFVIPFALTFLYFFMAGFYRSLMNFIKIIV